MASVIKMPRLSDTMSEGFIKGWNKKVGDKVKPGDVLAEVETDKATMDLEAFEEGTLLHIAVQQGPVPVDGIIAIVGQANEEFQHLLNPKKNTSDLIITATKNQGSSSDATNNSVLATPSEHASIASTTDQRIKASPLAKSIAREMGIPLNQLTGSGDHGRIVKKDVENFKPLTSTISKNSAQFAIGDKEVELSQMRKTIARRLAESKFTAPHFYLTTEVNMDSCVQARNQLNEISPVKISYNDLIVKACALALKSNPGVNVSWMGDKMVYHGDVHIGVAVAIEDGLVVPVVKHADLKSLISLKEEIGDKATRAKERKLNLDEMQGNTFTISNLGMFDIEHFTAIINPPDACILAVGSIQKKPAVVEDQLVISHRMKMTLSCDHRAVDGATGAKFLQSLKNLLEQPVSMLL
ncbi:MAG: 2-oxo acid dehydrogenase subunit E2 [Saprospiraceae bacterium]|nr:2-oxo acid dehydrogenase subunit E2 [Saprospiraceae bacterium]